MSKENGDNIIPSGPFKGKKIEFASTTGVDMFWSIAEEFMRVIFDMKPGSYMITDESSFHDFTGMDEIDMKEIHSRIHDAYGIDVSDLESGNLFEIFCRIHRA